MQLMPGQTIEVDYGTPDRSILLVRIDRHHDGISFTVTRPTKTTLDRTFLNDDLAGATAYMQYLHDAATAGQPVWLIEAGALALINASNALTQDTELIAAINDTMDAAKADLDANTAAQVEQVADIRPTNWHRLRAEIAERHPVRPIRPTRTRVHVKPPTPAQLDRMRQHRNGVVTCGQGQPWKLLDGLIQRGLADQDTAVYRPGTRQIQSVRLNSRGLAVAEQGQVAA